MNIAITKPKLGKDSKAFLAKKHHMLIDGKWVDAKSGKTFAVEDPATEEIIAHVPAGDKADIDLAVTAARRAFETGPWSRISPAERSQARLAAGRPARTARRRIRRARSARQRQAGHQRAPRRRRRLDRHVPLHGRLGDAPERRDDSRLEPGQLARLYAARAGRRRRPDHPLELPAHDGGLEAGAGAGRGLHDRAQARRADAALGLALRRTDRGSRHPRRRRQHRHRLSARPRARRSPIIPMSTRSPSPARPRSAS